MPVLESLFKTNDIEKIYLYVPYYNKDYVKKLGAKWDAEKKQWYIQNENKELIEKYGIDRKIYFDVPFKYNHLAKENNGQWDKKENKWFVYNNNEKDEILYRIQFIEDKNKINLIKNNVSDNQLLDVSDVSVLKKEKKKNLFI